MTSDTPCFMGEEEEAVKNWLEDSPETKREGDQGAAASQISVEQKVPVVETTSTAQESATTSDTKKKKGKRRSTPKASAPASSAAKKPKTDAQPPNPLARRLPMIDMDEIGDIVTAPDQNPESAPKKLKTDAPPQKPSARSSLPMIDMDESGEIVTAPDQNLEILRLEALKQLYINLLDALKSDVAPLMVAARALCSNFNARIEEAKASTTDPESQDLLREMESSIASLSTAVERYEARQ